MICAASTLLQKDNCLQLTHIPPVTTIILFDDDFFLLDQDNQDK